MKKIGLVLFIIFILSACSGAPTEGNAGDTSEFSFEEKISHLPEEAKNELTSFPDEIKEGLRIPSKLPSEPYTLDIQVNDQTDKIELVYMLFIGENSDWNLIVNSWSGEAEEDLNKNSNIETVTLANGIEAEYFEEGNILNMKWDENGVNHIVTLMQNNTNPDENLTKDEFLEIIHSMK